jgi:hypothetical protein
MAISNLLAPGRHGPTPRFQIFQHGHHGGRTLQRPMKSPHTSYSYPPGLQPLTAAGAVATRLTIEHLVP